MTDREMNLEGFQHDPQYTRIYSSKLDKLVFSCLEFDPDGRPALPEILFHTLEGLRQWETVYGDTNISEDEMPEYMKYPIDRREDIPIGGVAPDTWMGMQTGRKRKSTEAGLGENVPQVPIPPHRPRTGIVIQSPPRVDRPAKRPRLGSDGLPMGRPENWGVTEDPGNYIGKGKGRAP
jgi:hypothetical protein